MASGGRRGKPCRGSSRPKAKRTRYLSLSRIIVKTEVQTPPRSPEDDDDGRASSPPPPPTQEETEVKNEDGGGEGQPAEPFPLHHEASTLFAALPAPSLSDILGASASSSPPVSASPDDASSGGAGFPAAEGEDLARRALRGRERWVYCCSSSSSPTTTATTTCSSSPCSSAASTGASARTLLLKLDYDDVLAAWAGRGSFYIARAAPAPKPEPELENVLVEVQPPHHLPSEVAPCASRWSTPEAARSERAESVRRYKEKRRNRLFDKRIRYEVRRVNAVKRPRFKGRFVKEYDDEI